MKRKDTL